MDIAGTSATSAGTEAAATTTTNKALADKQAFLNLLVAQLKNQDPLNPTDGAEFLAQLAQFSEIEQLIGIREEIQGLRTDVTPPAADSASTTPAS